jgi:hypothetical protein
MVQGDAEYLHCILHAFIFSLQNIVVPYGIS